MHEGRRRVLGIVAAIPQFGQNSVAKLTQKETLATGEDGWLRGFEPLIFGYEPKMLSNFNNLQDAGGCLKAL